MRRLLYFYRLCAWSTFACWVLGGCLPAALAAGRLSADKPDAEATVRSAVELKQAADADPLLNACRYLSGELSRLERRLIADAADGHWDSHSLLTAALVAGGVDDDDSLRAYQEQVDRFVDALRRSGRVTGSPEQKAEAIFEFMHRRILRGGYQVDSTDLTLSLDAGYYNCVSSSVLFNCLADLFDLEVCGLEVPGHARSRLFLQQRTLDVETTCPGWFRLIDDPKRQAELVEATLGRRTDEGTLTAEARELSRVELVAMIYYNRGVDLLTQKQFAEAVAANAKALRLNSASTTARGNLLASLNNWAIDLGSRGQYSEAADLLKQGLALDPDYRTFKTNYVHVHYQWIDKLCTTGQYEKALDLLAAATQTIPGEPYFQQARVDVDQRRNRSTTGEDSE